MNDDCTILNAGAHMHHVDLFLLDF